MKPSLLRPFLLRVLWGRSPRRTLARVVLLAAGSWLVFTRIAPPLRVHGVSMEPTFHDGSLHFANLLAFKRRPPASGDIVVIRMAGTRAMYVKRVLAAPGDTVAFEDGGLIVNGEPRDEPYVAFREPWNMPPLRLGARDYFVVGDNRRMPMGDHALGLVERGRIAGGILF